MDDVNSAIEFVVTPEQGAHTVSVFDVGTSEADLVLRATGRYLPLERAFLNVMIEAMLIGMDGFSFKRMADIEKTWDYRIRLPFGTYPTIKQLLIDLAELKFVAEVNTLTTTGRLWLSAVEWDNLR